MVALDGNVEYVNDTFVESLGWSREAVLNAPASSLLADIPKAVISRKRCGLIAHGLDSSLTER